MLLIQQPSYYIFILMMYMLLWLCLQTGGRAFWILRSLMGFSMIPFYFYSKLTYFSLQGGDSSTKGAKLDREVESNINGEAQSFEEGASGHKQHMASTSVDNSASTSHVYSNAKHSDDHIRREIPATGIKDHKSSVHDQMVQHLASSIVSSCFWCMQSKLTLKFGSEALILQEEIIFWIKLCLHSEFT